MAAQDRQTTRDLTFLEEAKESPKQFSLFSLVRGLEARMRKKPPVGESRQPVQDIVDLRQIPHAKFPGSTLGEISEGKGRPVAEGYWLGLTGPMSPLPLHLTEYALYERRYAETKPFGRFLDLISGRFLQLFYRAWATARPAVHADRTENDRFSGWIDSLSGAREGTTTDSAFSGFSRLHYAAIYASRRSAGAIEAAMCHILGMPVEVHEFSPEWYPVEPANQTRLGVAHSTMGDIMVGSKVLLVDGTFDVKVITPDFDKFEALLPGGELHRVAAEALTSLAPTHLEWTLVPSLPAAAVPKLALGGTGRLGWSSWLGKDTDKDFRTDVRLRQNHAGSPAQLGA